MNNIITRAWKTIATALRSLHTAPTGTCSPCRVNCNQGRICPLHTARATPGPSTTKRALTPFGTTAAAVQTSARPAPNTTPNAVAVKAYEVRIRHKDCTSTTYVLANHVAHAHSIGMQHAIARHGPTASVAVLVKPRPAPTSPLRQASA